MSVFIKKFNQKIKTESAFWLFLVYYVTCLVVVLTLALLTLLIRGEVGGNADLYTIVYCVAPAVPLALILKPFAFFVVIGFVPMIGIICGMYDILVDKPSKKLLLIKLITCYYMIISFIIASALNIAILIGIEPGEILFP